jgi:hypothetical protein
MKTNQFFCKHEYPEFETKWVIEENSKYRSHGNVFRVCKKCGHRLFTSTFSETRSSDSAVSLIRDVAKEMGVLDRYNNQEGGSFLYTDFRSQVAEIYDEYGKDSARVLIVSELGRLS